MRIMGPDQYVMQQWKNGGGSTLELCRYPENQEDYLVRLSVAEVNSSGPFSLFPGCQRSICQLEGPAMQLTHPDSGAEKLLKVGEPYLFSGDHRTDCRVTGPARDFNVIWKEQLVDCSVERFDGPSNKVAIESADAAFLFVQKGSVTVCPKNEPAQSLGAQHLMIMEHLAQPAGIELAAGAAVFVVHLRQK